MSSTSTQDDVPRVTAPPVVPVEPPPALALDGESPAPRWEMNVVMALALWFSGMSVVDGDPMLWIPAVLVLAISVYSVLRNSGSALMVSVLITSGVVMTVLTFGAASHYF